MTVSKVSPERLSIPMAMGGTAVMGGFLALFATYWDESWHTDIGRDSAWIAPHVLLYGSVGLVGLVVAAWGLRTLHATRSIRATLGYQPVTVAALGGAAALAAAPIDQVWHARFGRDAVLWSPPHMLLVFASTALIVGLLAGLPHRSWVLRSAASVLLLGNAVAVVFEYETDVPQFSEIFYLPILIVTGLLVALVTRASVPVRFPVTAMVVGYAILRIAIAAVLALLGRSTPDLPLAVLGFALVDLPIAGVAQRYAAGAAATAALAWLASAIGLASQSPDAVAATAIPVLVVCALILIAGQRTRRWIPTAAGLLAAALLLVTPPAPASAHDPGQGEPMGRVELTGTSNGARLVTIHAAMAGCDGVTPSNVVARRAADVLREPLRALGGCAFEGSVEVPVDGRWFVYVELDRAGQRLEAWLPLDAGRSERIAEVREFYVPAHADAASRPTQLVAGTLIYVLGVGLLVAAARLTRQARIKHPSG